MRIIISPAKQMVEDHETAPHQGLPALIHRTQVLKEWICSLTYEEKKRLWRCSDSIATANEQRFAHMDLHEGLTPALLAFEGIQYKYMAPTIFEDAQLAYVQEHLRILSGFYGVLRPLDGVVPYRLEMQSKVLVQGHTNLYDFWGRLPYDEVMDSNRVLVNLASKEYSKVVERYLTPSDKCVTCVFGELKGERVVQKGVYVKMARGEMVRYMASVNAQAPEDLQSFSWSGYSFDEARSDATTYVFVRAIAK
ncbi:MAG: peroxide stress protein YaaA [Atopobiaceae bacterium]|nr:peroxide stress protein YaaA [Atopobiaceae bacterium]